MISSMAGNNNNGWFDMAVMPMGYRFAPTDEELIAYYLARKLKEQPLPPNTFKEVDIYNYTPEELEEEYGPRREKEMYFFTIPKLKFTNGNRPNRETRKGFWRASTQKTPIKDNKGLLIGHKMLLNYRDKNDKRQNTDWLMYEYTIIPNSKKIEYVLCKVYNKGSKYKLQTNEQQEEGRQKFLLPPQNIQPQWQPEEPWQNINPQAQVLGEPEQNIQPLSQMDQNQLDQQVELTQNIQPQSQPEEPWQNISPQALVLEEPEQNIQPLSQLDQNQLHQQAELISDQADFRVFREEIHQNIQFQVEPDDKAVEPNHSYDLAYQRDLAFQLADITYRNEDPPSTIGNMYWSQYYQIHDPQADSIDQQLDLGMVEECQQESFGSPLWS